MDQWTRRGPSDADLGLHYDAEPISRGDMTHTVTVVFDADSIILSTASAKKMAWDVLNHPDAPEIVQDQMNEAVAFISEFQLLTRNRLQQIQAHHASLFKSESR